ncbi:hypothetical protein TSAR_016652 [Trichomalopsis sarcophagae]|uniref:chitinase n=1 Tax=Trichomalopsis sarcophagae TaxID=543379 RepID=A0A232EW37_9HYME|nr:hypothetical protein TSAR_016652 [Trichomalopsis sarcophagae]
MVVTKKNSCRICLKVFCCADCRDNHENSKHPKPKCSLCVRQALPFGVASEEDSLKKSELLCHLVFNHLPLRCKLCGDRFWKNQDFLEAEPCRWWNERRRKDSKTGLKNDEELAATPDAERKLPLTPQVQPSSEANKSLRSIDTSSIIRLKQENFDSPPELARHTSTPVHHPAVALPGQKLQSGAGGVIPQFSLKTPCSFDKRYSSSATSSSSTFESRYYTGLSQLLSAGKNSNELDRVNQSEVDPTWNSPTYSILKKLEPLNVMKPEGLDSTEKRVRFSDQSVGSAASTSSSEPLPQGACPAASGVTSTDRRASVRASGSTPGRSRRVSRHRGTPQVRTRFAWSDYAADAQWLVVSRFRKQRRQSPAGGGFQPRSQASSRLVQDQGSRAHSSDARPSAGAAVAQRSFPRDSALPAGVAHDRGQHLPAAALPGPPKLLVGSKVLLLILLSTSVKSDEGEKRVVCYYTNWSVYRPGTAKFSPQNINPYLCTHLIYAFGGFTKDNTLKPFDKYQDIDKGGYAKFTGLKTYNKDLKTLLAIGGWNEASSRFSPMVADPHKRRKFVKNVVKFLRQNHFDGLDLDWEYPAFRDGGKPKDRENYASFVQELREEFEKEASKTGRPRLLLTMAVPAGIEYIDKGYDIPKLDEYLDFINLLSYDYHSAYEPAVNHHAPLRPIEEDNEYNYDNELTIDYTINHLIKSGATPGKIVVGIPTYGRSYTLFNEDATDLGSPADGPGAEGDATREKGYLAYYEICKSVQKDDWIVEKPNPKAMGPYAYKENQWVGYDDEDIVREKAKYVNQRKLGGIMFWSIDNDDFRGECHGRPYPLIEAAKEALLEENEKQKPDERPNAISSRKRNRITESTKSDSNTRKSNSNSNRKNTISRSVTTKRPSSKIRSRSNTKTRTQQKNDDESDDENAENSENVETTRAPNRSSRPQVTNRNRFRARQNINNRDNRKKQVSESTTTQRSRNNKITTPEPPTTPDPGSDFKCEDEGFFPHPRDCKKYFWCLDSGPSGLGIVANQFTCPSGLVFNKLADSCDYPRNVVCPKPKSKDAPSTTTQRTTTERDEISEEDDEYEEYEDEEDDVKEVEEKVEEKPKRLTTSTARPLLYKTISRSRPTTTSTTTTTTTTTTSAPFSTAATPRLSDDISEEEQDPRVIKELIDLIKKAGGIEQLEKQLAFQEKGESAQGTGQVTPATISKSLYDRVLNRQSGKNNLFKIPTSRLSTTRKTEEVKDTNEDEEQDEKIENDRSRSKVKFVNGPGRSQFEGLDEVPEVKSLRRYNKPKYVTIERHSSSTTSTKIDDELIEGESDDDEEEDNEEIASSEEKSISNVPEETSLPTQRSTPGYVNIRRTRPTTTTEISRNDNDIKEEDTIDNQPTPNLRQHTFRSTEQTQKATQEYTTPKSRYISINRFRSTTVTPEKEVKQSTIESSTVKPVTTSEILEKELVKDEKTITVAGESGRISISPFTTETPSTARLFSDLLSTVAPTTPYIDEDFDSTHHTTKRVLEANATPNPNIIEDSENQKDTEPVSRSRSAIANRGSSRFRQTTRSLDSNIKKSNDDLEQTKNSERYSRRYRRPLKATTVSNESEDTRVAKITPTQSTRSRNFYRQSRIKLDQQTADTFDNKARTIKNVDLPKTSTTFRSTLGSTVAVESSTEKLSTENLNIFTSEKEDTTEISQTETTPFIIEVTEPITSETFTSTYPVEEETFSSLESSLQTTVPSFLWNSYRTNMDNLNDEEIQTTIFDTTTESFNAKLSTIPSSSTATLSSTDQITKKILLRKRLSTTPTSVDRQPHDDVNSRRRKVVRRLRPLQDPNLNTTRSETTRGRSRYANERLSSEPSYQNSNNENDNQKSTTLSLNQSVKSKSRYIRRKIVKSPSTPTTSSTPTTVINKRKHIFERYRPTSGSLGKLDTLNDENDYNSADYNHDSVPKDTSKDSKSSQINSHLDVPDIPQEKIDISQTPEYRKSRTRFRIKNNEPKEFENFTPKNKVTSRYLSRTTSTTESSIQETLVPTKKFDYFADAIKRANQLQRTTPKFNNDNGVLVSTSKPLVTRLVTSIVESATTERQKISIKKKYSSLTSFTYIPKTTTVSPYSYLQRNKEKRKKQLINEVSPGFSTEQSVEWSTLPIESEFSDKKFTTESSDESSSTIEIESVSDELISHYPDYKEITTHKSISHFITEHPKKISISNNSLYNNKPENDQDYSFVKKSLLISPANQNDSNDTDGFIRIPVKFVGDPDNEYFLLQIPENKINISGISSILKIQVLNSDEFNVKNVNTLNDVNNTNISALDETVISTTSSPPSVNIETKILESKQSQEYEYPSSNFTTNTLIVKKEPTIRIENSTIATIKYADDSFIKNLGINSTVGQVTNSDGKLDIKNIEGAIYNLLNSTVKPKQAFFNPQLIKNNQNSTRKVHRQRVLIYRGAAKDQPLNNSTQKRWIMKKVVRKRIRRTKSKPTEDLETSDTAPEANVLDSFTEVSKPAVTRPNFRRKISTTISPQTTEESQLSTSSRRIISSDRRRQGQKYGSERIVPQTTYLVRSHPYKQITDYDYYEDEEERFVIGKTEGKLLITNRGFIKCLDQGNFPHPNSCKKFITCAKMVNGIVVGTEYTCPDKLSFDPIGGICNWSAGLGCIELSTDTDTDI